MKKDHANTLRRRVDFLKQRLRDPERSPGAKNFDIQEYCALKALLHDAQRVTALEYELEGTKETIARLEEENAALRCRNAVGERNGHEGTQSPPRDTDQPLDRG